MTETLLYNDSILTHGKRRNKTYDIFLRKHRSQSRQQTSNYIVSTDKNKVDKKQLPKTMPSLSAQVGTIIESFSLTNSHAARVLAITRPTVYAWKNSQDSCNVEVSKHQRLMKVYELAEQWNRYSLGPLGERAHVPFISDHQSIVGLLSNELLDDSVLEEVSSRLQLLSNKDRDVVLVGEKAARWRSAMGGTLPSWETQESNLENNLRALQDVD